MTNRERLHDPKNRNFLVEKFREALRAKVKIWNCNSDIEQVIGEIDGMSVILEDIAVNFGTDAEADRFPADRVISELEALLCNPEGDVEVDGC